jgi:hypothetical protein
MQMSRANYQKRPSRTAKERRKNLRLLQQRCHFHDGLQKVEVLAVDRRLEGFAVNVEDPEEDAENDGHHGQDDGRHGRGCGRSIVVQLLLQIRTALSDQAVIASLDHWTLIKRPDD